VDTGLTQNVLIFVELLTLKQAKESTMFY